MSGGGFHSLLMPGKKELAVGGGLVRAFRPEGPFTVLNTIHPRVLAGARGSLCGKQAVFPKNSVGMG